MKVVLKYIIMSFVLCFGIKAQAQNITAYETKLKSLPTMEADKLAELANGAPTSMFVTFEGEAKIHYSNSVVVVDMSITNVNEVTKLSTAFENNLKEVEIINLEWDGQEEIELPITLLNKMSNLKFIYIRSYQPLNEFTIQDRFQELLNVLKEKKNVEVLYYTMEQPS